MYLHSYRMREVFADLHQIRKAQKDRYEYRTERLTTETPAKVRITGFDANAEEMSLVLLGIKYYEFDWSASIVDLSIKCIKLVLAMLVRLTARQSWYDTRFVFMGDG